MDKKQKTKTKNFYDLIFTFKYVNIKFNVDESLCSVQEYKQLKQTVNTISESIHIDKSYVEFNGNKYNDTFLIEEGWNNLCKLVISTKFGKKISKKQNKILQSAYYAIIINYIYHILDLLDYNIDLIFLYLLKNGSFMVEIEKDTLQYWKK